MRILGTVSILLTLSGAGVSHAQGDLVFADGFEDGTACAWSDGNQVRWFEDLDQDSYGDPTVMIQQCSSPQGWVSNNDDCDDMNPGIFPGASAVHTDGVHQATVLVDESDCSFRMTTTAELLSGPPTSPRSFFHPVDLPRLSTGNLVFDALYSLALVEARENSVSEVQDPAYNGGAPIPCPTGGCFEGGRVDQFLRTRDVGYAVDLGLALIDPGRARNSLEVRLSERRGGGDLQILQDPGTGGSYPVSTDRVVWAIGARRLIDFLDGTDRQAFQDLAWEAVRNTIEHDRSAVFDAGLHLYRGETSFLDWREQSYPAWTASKPVQIAASMGLSTNVAHLLVLEFGSWLAGEAGDTARQTMFQSWADDLRASMNLAFFHDTLAAWGSFIPGGVDIAPVARIDLLGTSLAVLAGVGDGTRRASAVRRYPHLEKGPPVFWPQQQEVAIYHNRGQWPFATAYFLRAARDVENDAVVNHDIRAMIRGAAMNLSHLDVFEMVTGAPWLDDGITSGPVVNSQRRLWSVAGYLSMVQDVVFGLDSTPDGIRFLPYVTRDLRNALFAGVDRLKLIDLEYLGHLITVTLHLPAAGGLNQGAYTIGEIRLNGQPVTQDFILPSQLQGSNELEIDLLDVPGNTDSLNLVSDLADDSLFSPKTPQVTGVALGGGHLEVSFNGGGESPSEIQFNIFRDGVEVASTVSGSSVSWTDSSTTPDSPSHCYSVETSYSSSGNHSQHAYPSCWLGSFFERVRFVDATSFVAVGGTLSMDYGRWHYADWGEPGHTLTVDGLVPDYTGPHLLRVTYGNGAGAVESGITCGVKRVEVVDEASAAVVGSGVLVMPHLGTWNEWSESSFVPVTLDSGRSYRISIFHDDSSQNMSDRQFNATYYDGVGGTGGAYHDVNIAEIVLISLTSGP